MKTKTKSKRGKAIMGIALAAIMLASVFAAMVPTASAGAAREPDGNITSGNTIFLGEHGLHFNTIAYPDIVSLQKFEDTTLVATIPIANPRSFSISTSEETGGYQVWNDTHDIGARITIKDPSITGKVYLAGTTDSIVGKSIPEGQLIKIRASPNFGGLMNYTGGWSTIIVKRIDPDGVAVVMAEDIDANASEINIDDIDTTDWDTGEWTIKIGTNKTTCNEVDVESSDYKFTIRSVELDIKAKEDEVGKGDDIILTISGKPKYYYYFAIEDLVAGEEPVIQATEGVTRNTTCTEAWVKMNTAGTRDIKIETTGADDRTYTMHVWDTFDVTNAVPNATDRWALPTAVKNWEDDADVDVEVREADVTWDMPRSGIVGAEITIKGRISAGDKVDILIEDGRYAAWNNEPVDEDKEFEVKWKTEGLPTGSYTIDVYIDANDQDYNAEDATGRSNILAELEEGGTTSITLSSGELTAEQLRNIVAEDDHWEVEGTATGVDDVDIVLIGPDGYYPPEKSGPYSTGVLTGLYITSTSVRDDEFDEDVKMKKGLDTGMWIGVVLSPGRDGYYEGTDIQVRAGNLESATDLIAACVGKDREGVLAILKDRTAETAGSDDQIWVLSFKVESASVTLNPVEPVAIGEPLNISGTTNREPDTRITISTLAGPMDLLTEIAEVKWSTPDEGVFSVTIDTTDAVVGTYTLEADDGDGHTDAVDVELVEEIVPIATPTPTAKPMVTPVVPTAEPTPTPTPEPTPTPTPGFEAVFAIAGLLSIAYLVLRRRK